MCCALEEKLLKKIFNYTGIEQLLTIFSLYNFKTFCMNIQNIIIRFYIYLHTHTGSSVYTWNVKSIKLMGLPNLIIGTWKITWCEYFGFTATSKNDVTSDTQRRLTASSVIKICLNISRQKCIWLLCIC